VFYAGEYHNPAVGDNLTEQQGGFVETHSLVGITRQHDDPRALGNPRGMAKRRNLVHVDGEKAGCPQPHPLISRPVEEGR